MNKAELIEAIAEDLTVGGEVPKTTIERILNSEQKVVKATLAKGEPVKLIGYGTYEAVPQAARTIKNPRTKKEQTTEAKMKPKFKASKEFKDLVANSLAVK